MLNKILELLPKEKKISLIVSEFNGSTKIGKITEEGYEALKDEMEKRGHNDCLEEVKSKLPEIIEVIKKEMVKEIQEIADHTKPNLLLNEIVDKFYK